MKIIRNEKLVKRNSQIGQWTSLAALGVLGIGMYISFQRPDLVAYSITALIVGFGMTQVGLFFSNRWGRNPRPDEQLDAGLKGLPNEDTIYHYMVPAAHLYVGSAGIWIFLPYHQRGRVAFQKNRWQLTGGGFMQSYMSIFGQEGLGRPELEFASEADGIKKYLARKMDENEIPEINGALVFTNDQIEIEDSGAPLPALKLKQLKDFMRQKSKERSVGPLTLQKISAALPQAE
jgi:hypothetical protein